MVFPIDRRVLRAGARGLLLVISLTLVLLLGESVARVFAPPTAPPRRVVRAGLEGLPVIEGIDALAQKNVDGVHKGVRFSTNSHGFRGPDRAARAAPGVLRVVVSGDSVTMGWGVDFSETYSEVMEQRLNARLGDPASRPELVELEAIEVINVGLAGINAAAAVGRVIAADELYAPDLAIYGFTVNDIEGPNYRNTMDPEVARALNARYRLHSSSPSHLLRAVWPNWVALTEWVSPTPGSPEQALHENYFDNPQAWRDFDAALSRFAAHTRARGICGHVFIHAKLTQFGPFHPYRPYYARVAAAARAHGLSVSESLDRFPAYGAEQFWVHLYDPHPNVRGHRIYAEALGDAILGLPPDCLRPARR